MQRLLLSVFLLSLHESKQTVFNTSQTLLDRLKPKGVFFIKISNHFSDEGTNMSFPTVLFQKMMCYFINCDTHFWHISYSF